MKQLLINAQLEIEKNETVIKSIKKYLQRKINQSVKKQFSAYTFIDENNRGFKFYETYCYLMDIYKLDPSVRIKVSFIAIDNMKSAQKLKLEKAIEDKNIQYGDYNASKHELWYVFEYFVSVEDITKDITKGILSLGAPPLRMILSTCYSPTKS